jgi:enamine deaminase RidA (YjgF/YER057c/UK114 family)
MRPGRVVAPRIAADRCRGAELSSKLEVSNPEGVHAPLGPYSHTVFVPAGGGLLFVSGQIGVAPDGSCASTIEGQADQAFRNLTGLLAAHDLDVSSVIKLTVFIVVGHDGGAVREARERYFGSVAPASTTVYVSGLVRPEWFIEVEAVAQKM